MRLVTCLMQEPGVTVIVSVSPQSRASLAEAAGLTPQQVLRRLTGFFRNLGVALVLDTTASRDFSLAETAAEFVHRYRLAHPDAAAGSAAAADAHANSRANGGPILFVTLLYPLSPFCCCSEFPSRLHRLECVE